ncbi:MAG: hypothetical protein Alpg2KO_07930 [Alphaproteobacteria bacterium]
MGDCIVAKSEYRRGASLLSYGLIVGLIAVVALTAVTSVGDSQNSLMTQVADTMNAATEGTLGANSGSAGAESTPAQSQASCLDLLNAGQSTGNGIYTIDRGSGDESVFCDMAGGGYTWPLDDATTFGQTVLYIPMDGTDNASVANQAPSGGASVTTLNASYNTSQAVFGSDSLYVTRYINSTGVPSLTGDFTIDFWLRVAGLQSGCNPIFQFDSHPTSGGLTLFNCGTGSNTSAGQYHGASGWPSGSSGPASDGAVQLNTWRHIAVTRQGSTIRTFIDGSLHQTETYSTAISASPFRMLERVESSTYAMDAYLEEVRIINGTAVWTSGFTPPTEPYRFQ